MTRFIQRFWIVCLVPLVVPLYFLPWQILAGLAIVAALSFAWRYSE